MEACLFTRQLIDWLSADAPADQFEKKTCFHFVLELYKPIVILFTFPPKTLYVIVINYIILVVL